MNHHDYRTTLEPWIRFARTLLFRSPQDADATVYGVGDSGHWSIQAHSTALAAYAVLATDPDTDPASTGCSHEELAQTARAMLRFFCRAHHSGSGCALDGKAWGHSWISALAIERVAHGVGQLEKAGLLSAEDLASWRALLRSEADWLLDCYPVEADISARSGKNKPESNLWNGCLLLRAAAENPRDVRVSAWNDKARRFLLNSISLPADGEHTGAGGKLVCGRPLADWHVGANFTENFGLNHHGYLNTGYMVICLSNLAMLHLSLRMKKISAPEELYHNASGLWQLLQMLISPEGRLLRIGGDSRARYCYCQDYLIPTWQLARDRFGCDCAAVEAGWLATIRRERDGNPDGSFLGTRLAQMRKESRLYYARLEGDRAVSLSLGALWRKEFPAAPVTSAQQSSAAYEVQQTAEEPVFPRRGTWADSFHGAVAVSGERRFASWVWDAAEKPQGLFLPGAHGDMAEWRRNLAGEITGDGAFTENRVTHGDCREFPGGFVFSGAYRAVTCLQMYEGGEAERVVGECRLAGATLPDDGTWIGLQYATSADCRPLCGWKGLNLLLPNDAFNQYARSYRSAKGTFQTAGLQEDRHRCGDWLCVDDSLWAGRIYGAGELQIVNPGERQIGLMPATGRAHFERLGCTIAADELTLGRSDEFTIPANATTLFDLGFVLRCGNLGQEGLEDCAQVPRINLPDNAATPHADLVRTVRVRGMDGKHYLFIANFSEQSQTVQVRLEHAKVLRPLILECEENAPGSSSTGEFRISLAANAAQLYEITG